MKRILGTVLLGFVLLVAATAARAADFDWLKDLSVQAQADPAGFRARLATRFQIGDAKISAVLSNFPDAAHAYVALRMGEIAHLPPERVIERYKANQKKGWGAIAKGMGIEPGSAAFHALKAGHDLDGRGKDKGRVGDKGKGKDKDRGGPGRDRDDRDGGKGKGGPGSAGKI
jgi:hypothetical protein